MPAFEPNPRKANTKITPRLAGESEAAPARKSANPPEPPFIRRTNAESNMTSPACVIATYHNPACSVPSSLDSVMTRKYEVSDIPSHISRNVRTLLASGTRLIVNRQRLNITPSMRREARPSS